LAEYRTAPDATRRTYTTELEAFAKKFPRMGMLELSQETLEAWTGRKSADGKPPAARTRRGRITTFITFLNRARDWNLIGPGKHAAALLRRPVIPDAGREILSVAQGAALLAAVRAEEPKLEAYFLIAGWLGLRPSECQRLTWGAFDFARGYCHVSTETAQKTSTERYVPMDGRLGERLKELFAASGKTAGQKVCGFRSREFLSVLARKAGVLDKWPPDVLRHSFCSYRLAVLGDIAKVADEAGNSPAIIRTNYRRPVLPEDGAAWWNVVAAVTPDGGGD
jgi:integrase